ncbi:hypothetical protein Q783_12030 (plasmid) [Carnobacterium inhibens subsp. gilichinskyi]|uniref:Uncharacterized protein n=2 Tax=Carnobacterium inhibens TaxID=147709 RepID=U5SDA3_9LACT|nr:hypothetical protein Q783_12030 [Carnobacterium inhibens subsp. gilichinskyi]
MIIFGVIKEIIVNHYNNGTLQSRKEFLDRLLEKNMEETAISISEYELLKETIDDLSTK